MSVRKLATEPPAGTLALDSAMLVARLVDIKEDGWLVVRGSNDQVFACLWLETSSHPVVLTVGDMLMVRQGEADVPPIVMGRVRPYRQPPTPALMIEAAESLTLKCGDALMELRANGQVMIKGQDLVLRAKGTQRIRAGTVAIN